MAQPTDSHSLHRLAILTCAFADLPFRYREAIRPDQRIRRSPIDATPPRTPIVVLMQQARALISQRRPPRKHIGAGSKVRRGQEIRRLLPIDTARAGQIAHVVKRAPGLVINDPVVRPLVADWKRPFAWQRAQEILARAVADFLQHLAVGHLVEDGDGRGAGDDALCSVGLGGGLDNLDRIDAVRHQLVVPVWLS